LPTIEIDYEDFQSLVRVKLPSDLEELNDILSYVKGEVKLIEGNEVHIEILDTNRPDLWCTEGLARALRGYLGIERGLKKYEVKGESGVEVWVDSKLWDIRPYIACAVVKNVQVDNVIIQQLMHLQDKMDQTYGRKRSRTSIGLYNFDLISPPLRYGVAKPREISFVPLEFEEELTLEEILKKHPKGIEYGHLVQSYPVFPIFMDSKNNVLSFPPIINSNDLGRITEDTRNILIEVTGTVHDTVLSTLSNIALSLADREGNIFSVKVHYPYETLKETMTPQLKTQVLKIDMNYIQKVLGIEIKPHEVKDLLERARFGVIDVKGSEITLEIPCYRVDIMHPIDVMEDIAIAYDYNKIGARWPSLSTIGEVSPRESFRNLTREIMVGLGYQEISTFTMSNPNNLFARMNISRQRVVEVENPKITTLTCIRNWLLPSLMEFLSHNIHVEYPQRVFEVGYCVTLDGKMENRTRELERLACVTIHSDANFTEIKSTLDAFLINIGITQYELEAIKHKSFIEGRVGKIIVNNEDIGLIGEIHPQVLENWKLENPVATLEITLDKIYESTPKISE